jgi:hypothetical protein
MERLGAIIPAPPGALCGQGDGITGGHYIFYSSDESFFPPFSIIVAPILVPLITVSTLQEPFLSISSQVDLHSGILRFVSDVVFVFHPRHI